MDSAKTGLSSAEAALRLERSGPNELFKPSEVTFLDILWEEVREPMILLLLVVGVLYSLLGEARDAVTIFVVILLLTLAEVNNEFRAKRAIQRLSEIAAPQATVVRDGEVRRIDASGVVIGDTLVLTAGTRLVADASVAQTVGLQVDESSITGESYPAEKPVGSQVLAGTTVVNGTGIAVVTATGAATQLGKLAEGLKTVKPPKTPLQKAMKDLSGKLVWVALFFSVLIPLVGVLRGKPLGQMLLVGLSLSFATIPEELPIIITMVLGLGSYRLSKHSFLVRRLAAAETMGSVNVIVTDKTGTLTESRMTLTGITSEGTADDAIAAAMGAISEIDTTPLDEAIRAEANRVKVKPDRRGIVRRRDVGEGAKTKAVLRDDGWLYVSGAPEEVFARCASVPDAARSTFEAQAAKGDRLIAVARREVPKSDSRASWAELERNLEFVALLGFSDPPRPEVAGAIAAMREAGVRTIMVTGDYPATASAIASEVGIGDGTPGVITGAELDAMDDDTLASRVMDTDVFARANPQHKYRLVEALQKAGLRVAVTGDGINDALAIKGADIGIAMGIRGTDVAKEAADVVLADDNYATIANAVFEGRTFYDNLRKGVKYYLSVKIALIGVFLLPALFGLPLPFSPVQIILLELFMDLAASAGFVAEPAEPDIRVRRPETMKTRILDEPQLRDLFLKGFFLFVAVMATYGYAAATGMSEAGQRSLAFAAWMMGHVFLAFVSRSDRQPLARVGLFSNKIVNLWALATAVFLAAGLYVPAISVRINLVSVPVAELVIVGAIEIVWMSLLELRKYVRASSARARSADFAQQ